MAELNLRVKAEYDSAIKCREELDKVVSKMKALSESSSPKEVEALTKRYVELTTKYEQSISFIGKSFAYMKEVASGVEKSIRYSADSTKDLGTTTKSVIEAAQKRLQLEKNILDSIKLQRAEAEKQRNEVGKKHNDKVDEYSALKQNLSDKYGGKAEGFYDDKDREALENLRDELKQTKIEFDNYNHQIMVCDQLLEESRERTNQLNQAISGATNVYKGFADTVESTSTKIFISEDVFNRYHELSSVIEDLKKEIQDVSSEPDIDMPRLQELQKQLAESQEEFRALDESARGAAAILGHDLSEKVSKSLERLYSLNDIVRKVDDEFKDLEQKLIAAKKELAEAKDPAAITKAREEVDRLQVSLDSASDRLTKFKAQQKDALTEIEKLRKSLDNDVPEGNDITEEVSDQVKGLMGKIAAMAGIGIGLSELKDFFSQSKYWREYFQDIESSMKVFLGSAEKGAEFTSKLKGYAYYNMFEFSDLAAASQQMISYGHNVESIIPRLDQLSNVATGTHGSLMELVDAYNRAKATGVVDARGVQSWAVKGVMIRDVLRDMGETVAGTTITFEQLNKVLDHVTGEGGQFHNLMLEMMDNISAESGQLEDNLSAMYENIGSKFESVFVKFLKLQSAMAEGHSSIVSDSLLDWGAEKANAVLDDLLENWEEYIGYIKDAVAVYGIYRAALIANIAMEKASAAWKGFNAAAVKLSELATKKEMAAKMAESVAEGTNTAATTLNTAAKTKNATATQLLTLASIRLKTALMAHPYALVVAGLAAIAYAIYSTYSATMTQEKAQRLLNKASEDYADTIKEQEQKDRDNIRVIQDKTASLVAQTKAYKDLTKERAVFARYSKEEIANMTSDQISTLIGQDNEQKNEDRLRKQLAAAKELEQIFDRRGAAWTFFDRDSDIDEVVKKFGLLPEYAQKLKDSIDSMTGMRTWASELAKASADELQEFLSENAESGIVEGFRKGFSNSEMQATAAQMINNYTAQISAATYDAESKIDTLQKRIDDMQSGKDKKYYGVMLTRQVRKLKDEIDSVNKSLEVSKKKIADTFGEQIRKQIEIAQENVEGLNRELINATGSKKTEIEMQWKGANDDLNTLQNVMDYFEAGVVNKDLVINIQSNIEDALIGDEKLIEIGDRYAEIEDMAAKVINGIESARKEMNDYTELSVEQAEIIAEKYGISAESVSSSFGKTYDDISKDISDLQDKLNKATDPSEKHKIQLEINEKEKLLAYISDVKTQIEDVTSNPYTLKLNIVGKAEKWLKDLLKAAGYEIPNSESKNTTGNWGENGWADNGLERLGIQTDASKRRQAAQTARTKAEEAKVRNQKTTGPDKKTGKQWEAERLKSLRQEKKNLEAELKTPLTQAEAETKQKRLDQINSELKKGAKVDKDVLNRRQRDYDQFLKNREQQQKQELSALNAAEEARLAGIENAAEKERETRKNQFRLTQQQINEKIEAFKKANVEQEKAEWSNKKENKDKIWADTKTAQDIKNNGYKNVALTKAQNDEIDALNRKLYNDKMRYVSDQQKEERQATYELLKTWGDYEQQKWAIIQSYEEKIREATSPQEQAGYSMQRDKEIEELGKKQIEEAVDWNGVFSELQGHTKEYLEGLRDQLQDLLKTGKVTDVTQLATLQEKIREINGEISKQGGLFDFVGDRQREHNRLIEEAAAAEERRKKAVDEQHDLESQQKFTEFKVRNAFEEMGIDRDTDIDLGKGGTLDSIKETYGEESEQYKKLAPMLNNMATNELKLADARKKTNDATKEAKNAEDSAKRKSAQAVADWFSDAQQFITEKGIDQIPDLLNEVGLGSVGEKAAKGLSAFNNASAAAEDFANGNYIGAALKGISAIKDVVGIFGGGSNAQEMIDVQKKMTDKMDANTYAIEKMTEALEKSYGAEAIKNAQEVEKRLEDNMKSAVKGIDAVLTSDYGKGHSDYYHLNKNQSVISKISRYGSEFGINAYDRSEGQYTWQKLLSYNPEKLAQLFEKIHLEDAELWRLITKESGYNEGALEEWLNKLTDTYDQIKENDKQLMEQLTTTTEEGVFNDFLNQLYNLAEGSSTVFTDISNGWQDMVNKMVINNLVGQDFQENLVEWRKKLYELNKKRQEKNKSEFTDAQYKAELNKLKEEYQQYVKQAQDEINTYREAGIISNPKEAQSATAKSISNISYEQADSLVGIGISSQMALEQSSEKLDMLNTKFDQALIPIGEARDIAADSRDILAGMAIHVEEIRDGVVDIIVPKIKDMSNELTRVRKAVEEQ